MTFQIRHQTKAEAASKALRSGKIFEVPWIFVKIDLRNQKFRYKISGLFWQSKPKPKILSTVETETENWLTQKITDHFFENMSNLGHSIDYNFWKSFENLKNRDFKIFEYFEYFRHIFDICRKFW